VVQGSALEDHADGEDSDPDADSDSPADTAVST
jgi:hypothetical protein